MKLLEEKVPDFLKEYPELVEWINEEDELHNIFTFFCTFFDKSYKMKDIKNINSWFDVVNSISLSSDEKLLNVLHSTILPNIFDNPEYDDKQIQNMKKYMSTSLRNTVNENRHFLGYPKEL